MTDIKDPVVIENIVVRDLVRVQSTATDGRLANIFWRQDQLRALHGALVTHEKDALAAIEHDAPHNTPTEAKLEFYLALAAVKQQYSSLDPQRSLDDEYRIKHGKDASDRRDAVGIVYIEPSTQHTLFYSALVALASAIAAGNCVVLRLETTSIRRVPSILQTILKASLDPDVYAIISSPPSGWLDPATTIQVLQNGAPENAPTSSQDLVSPTRARVLAVVDRTADIPAAARSLVAARFSYGGRSPYAPDLVLVNEFVKTAFLEAAVQETIRFLAEGGSNGSSTNGAANGNVKVRREKEDAELSELKTAESVRVVTSGANGAVVEIESRTSPLISKAKKIHTRCLAIHATTSLDDSIDLLNRQHATQPTPLAAYLFADPASAKYLAQFLRARATYTNHVPYKLLLGPALPVVAAALPSASASPYPPSLFTTPHPDFAVPSSLSASLSTILASTTKTTSTSSSPLNALAKDATAPLPPNRKYKKGVGFFEQGILIGLGLTAGPILVGVLAATWVGGRWVWGHYYGR
ncbi:Aldehyde/histidinol dehydrogenase [Phyllosticta capitalensis]